MTPDKKNQVNGADIPHSETPTAQGKNQRELERQKQLAAEKAEKAKKELSYLVSRDTNTLSLDKIIMSVVETIAENTVDGFASPAFYAFIGSFFSISIFGKDVFERHFFNTRLTVIPNVVNLDKKDSIKYLK